MSKSNQRLRVEALSEKVWAALDSKLDDIRRLSDSPPRLPEDATLIAFVMNAVVGEIHARRGNAEEECP